VTLAASVLVAGAAAAAAQTFDHPPPPDGYRPIVPDIPHAVEDATSIEHKWIKVHFGLAPIYDYTWLTQDEASVEQVGVQEDQGQWRSGRIQARGTLFNHHARPWRFLLSFEYRGFDSNPDETWTWTDVSLTVPVGPLGDLSMGKIKEPFVYEMVGDAANLPHLERLLSPFFTSRSIGVRLDKSLFDQRATAAIGAYNDWFVKDLDYDDSGWDIAGRVTTVPVWANDGKRYLHLGGGWRYVGADDGLLRYRGRPESNVTDYYLDATFGGAKGIPASHANHWSAEALWNEGPVSVLAEYTGARVSSDEARDPRFGGWYVVGSWVVTGEHRPYDRKVGYARRVLPTHRWGALELIARYGEVDTVDNGIDGGYLEKWFTAANWWATRRWRFSLGYGRGTLDRDGLSGETGQTLARVQWIY
jgi:phosphate-selective porin OprO/OprP